MKIKLPPTLKTGLLLVLLYSCSSETQPGKAENLQGIYSFSTREGFYGEIWFGEDNLVISKRNRPLALFPYRAVGDTIKMYGDTVSKNADHLLDYIVVKERSDSSITIRQDTVTNYLKLVDREVPPINNDGATFRTIKEQFRERLNSRR